MKCRHFDLVGSQTVIAWIALNRDNLKPRGLTSTAHEPSTGKTNSAMLGTPTKRQ
jgi:hypothetical protein